MVTRPALLTGMQERIDSTRRLLVFLILSFLFEEFLRIL
jgi:hypothetical protein